MSVTSCYATGLTNGTVFVGENSSSSFPKTENNYYLSGVNKAKLTGANVKGAKVGDAGTPFAEQTTEVNTNKYDASLEGDYPYQMISGQFVYYGDWVVPKNTQEIDGSFGILYYEIVQHGDKANATKSAYYHGFVGNAVPGGNISKDSYKEISTRTTLPESQSPGEINEHGLLAAPEGGEYVTEDGYILLVSNKNDLDDTFIGWKGNTNWDDLNQISVLINSKILIPYDEVTRNLNIEGYHAYYFNAKNSSVIDRQSWYGNDPTLRVVFSNSNRADALKTSFHIIPYFADCISTGVEAGSYYIRSAHQLNILFNTLKGGKYLGLSGSGNGTVITQTMDISYNNNVVKFTEFGKGTFFSSPQLDTMANTYQGKINQNKYVYKLDHLTQSLLSESTNHYPVYTLNNLHITNMSADSLVGNNYGTLSLNYSSRLGFPKPTHEILKKSNRDF